MARAGQVPDAAIVSPARRAEDTLRWAMTAGGWTCPTRTAEPLYGGGVSGLLAEIRPEPATTDLLLAVGHEPAWSESLAVLVGGGRLRFPTAALARVDLDIDAWNGVGPGTGVLAWSVVPRLLTKGGR